MVAVSKQTNKDIKLKIYESALHGFDNFEFPPSKEVIDEKGEHYHIGYNGTARQQARQDLLSYFEQNLKGV